MGNRQSQAKKGGGGEAVGEEISTPELGPGHLT